MRLPCLSLVTLLVVLGLAPPAAADSLVVCGWDEVFVLDVTQPTAPRKTWSWRAADRPELPEAYRALFRSTDDCKPVGADRMLITASSDGAALVDVATGRALWWGRCGNTHSAEMLPRDRVVLACSVRPETGNRLAVFDVERPDRVVFTTELESGHGVVWDAARQRLWALGLRELRAYALVDWSSSTPSLRLVSRATLPGEGGHELTPVPASADLIVSATEGVWRFNRDTQRFSPDPDLAGKAHVKSAVVDARSGRLAWTQADEPDWWTSRIRLAHPDAIVTLPGERLYKVRWRP
ncbi:MAG TPA: DUF6528 family protein [Luteitalea sp.]|nr:DUF6528 family protein [Luteitalea sp.]